MVLISKNENLTIMNDLHPLALYNVVYKIIAKLLVNELKVLLLELILENSTKYSSWVGLSQTM